MDNTLLLIVLTAIAYFTLRVNYATGRIARLSWHMAALQLLAIAGYYASLRLALHQPKRTLHPVQLRILG